MRTWLIDTALCKMLASEKATRLKQWSEANNASLFLSAISLAEVTAGIAKISSSQPQRRDELRKWLDALNSRFAGRIHGVDAAICVRAGELLSRFATGYPRHRLHDAVLVATAQAHGHGLVTRREATFGAWTQTPIAVI